MEVVVEKIKLLRATRYELEAIEAALEFMLAKDKTLKPKSVRAIKTLIKRIDKILRP